MTQYPMSVVLKSKTKINSHINKQFYGDVLLLIMKWSKYEY